MIHPPRTPRPSKPLYQVAEDYIRELIESEALVPGDLVPSEPQLAKTLGMSQGTVKKAIDNLVWQKRLFRHQGKGTYVSSFDFNNSLFRFATYGDAAGKDARIHKETTERRVAPGSAEVCRQLRIPPRSNVLHMERIGYIDQKPVLVEYSRWRADIVAGLEDEDVHIPDLLYALVVEKYRVPVVRAEETLSAEALDKKTADKLEIATGTPVLVLKRVTYTTKNEIIEVRTTKGRGDKFSYKAEIR